MYYKSRRNKLMNWLGNTNLKPYVIILVSLLLVSVIILVMSRQQISEYFSAERQEETLVSENGNTEAQVTEASSEEPVTEPSVLAYLIKVNKADNMVSVWNTINGEIDSIEALFYASINEELAEGRYEISEKNAWRTLEDYTCVQYSSKSDTQILFHSPSYEFQNRGYMIVESYQAIGDSNNLVPGVTLTVGDAKWIYENCAESTPVEVCEEANADYGMSAQEIRTIPDGIRWDPTDPDRGNKWVSTQIKFLQGVTDKTITVGTSIDPWNGVYAQAIDGSNITNNLTIRNHVDVNTPGIYTIEYILADFTGQVVRQYSTVTVEAVEPVTEPAGEETAGTDGEISN